MKNYELMLIIDSSLSDKEKVLEDIKNNITSKSWVIKKEDIWGDRAMAYKINNSYKWFYVLYNLELDWKNIIELTKIFNLNNNIIRHIFVKQD